MIFLSVFRSGCDEAQHLISSDPRSKLQENQIAFDKHSLGLQDFNLQQVNITGKTPTLEKW